MKFKEVYDNFYEVEEKLDLFQKEISGQSFWANIRPMIIEYLLMENLDIAYPNPLVSVEWSLRNLLGIVIRSIPNFIMKNPFFSTEKEILFFGFPRRKLYLDKKWWDIFCDPIIDNLDRSYELIEHYYGGRHFKPVKTPNIRYIDFITFITNMKIFFRITRIKYSSKDKELLKIISNEFKARFQYNLDLEKLVKKDLLIRKSLLPLYRKYLQIVKPKLIIGTLLNNRWSPLEAAKDLNIPVIELQHGVIHPFHLTYSYPGVERTKKIFPDYIFVFGDFWKDSVEFPLPKNRIISVGYAFLEKEVIDLKNLVKKDQIIFVTSAECGEELTKLAVKLNDRQRVHMNVIIKLHPGEYDRWRTLYPWLIGSSIQVIDNDNTPLHRLLAESKIQVGVNSTVIYEGLNFGLRTYLLDTQWVETMEYLVTKGYARLISTVEQLEHEILKGGFNQIIDASYFFKNDAVQNIFLEIKKIINKA